MGHRLQLHPGLCKNVHGHRYVCHVSIQGPITDTGMVMDFHDLDILLNTTLGEWDHAMMLEMWDPLLAVLQSADKTLRLVEVPWPPTAERIVGEIARLIRHELPEDVTLTKIVLFETPKSSAEWVG